MKKLTYISLTIIVLISVYGFYLEPMNLESTSHEVSLGESGKSLLIAHLSDLHSAGLGNLEKNVINEIHERKPDVIVITGDLATPGGTKEGYQLLLKQFSAPLGVYFVKGNWDHWEPIQNLDDVLKNAQITNLTNKSIELKEGLWLIGFDDGPTGTPNMVTLDDVPTTAKIISLFHSPVFFDSISKRVDLALAGHTHGGQIRLPLLGTYWLPEGSGEYDIGWYQKNRARMYISRGIGNSIVPIRFNCRPEVAFINLKY